MIIVISGGIGSGKTLTAVRHSVEECKNNSVLTNFTLKGVKNYYRLKRDDVLLEHEEGKKKTVKINWEFWEKHRNCDVFLDELHNLISSRQAMSKQNQAFSEWIAQIRKIWGSQGDQNEIDKLKQMNNNAFRKYADHIIAKSNNIYLITQRVRKIDINFRELCHIYIQCQKIKLGKKVIIINNYWFGDDNINAIECFEMGVKPKRTYFVGNNYFKHYDSYELISTGGEYL